MDLQELELFLDKFEAESALALTKHEVTCVLCRIPDSGDPDIDKIITKAQRRDVAVRGLYATDSSGKYADAVREADELLAELAQTESSDVAD